MQFAGAQLLDLFREGLQKVQELGSVGHSAMGSAMSGRRMIADATRQSSYFEGARGVKLKVRFTLPPNAA